MQLLSASSDVLPAAHGVQALRSRLTMLPDAQLSQLREPAPLLYSPAAHSTHAAASLSRERPSSVLPRLPGLQRAHCASEVIAGRVLNLPIEQLKHCLTEVRPVAAPKVPDGHSLHEASPELLPKVPMGHGGQWKYP